MAYLRPIPAPCVRTASGSQPRHFKPIHPQIKNPYQVILQDQFIQRN